MKLFAWIPGVAGAGSISEGAEGPRHGLNGSIVAATAPYELALAPSRFNERLAANVVELGRQLHDCLVCPEIELRANLVAASLTVLRSKPIIELVSARVPTTHLGSRPHLRRRHSVLPPAKRLLRVLHCLTNIGRPEPNHIRHLSVGAPRQPGDLVIRLQLQDFDRTDHWFLFTPQVRVVHQLW